MVVKIKMKLFNHYLVASAVLLLMFQFGSILLTVILLYPSFHFIFLGFL